jgi:long-chain acyl-CoA synthetase
LSEHNLALLGEEAFARHGDYESLVFEDRRHRSGELFERGRRLAGGLLELGVEPGDRVAVLAANCPEVGVAYAAIWRAGAVVLPAIFLLSTEELRHILRESEARAVVTTPEFTATVAEAADGVESVRSIVSTGPAEDGVLSLASVEEAGPAAIVPRADSELAALLYTGGTTGRAKGVMLSHENLWQAGKAGQEAGHIEGVSRGLATLPLAHSYGLLVTVVGLHSPEPGVTALLRWFQPTAFLELVQEHRIQISAVVPSMIHALLAAPLEEFDLDSLRYLVSGAAPLARETAEELRRRLPQLELREGYGLTETAALVSSNRPGNVKPGSVGQPVPGTEVRIVDDDGRELARGEVGEICCRSPMVMCGYWREPELTAEATRGGWLHTGDLGYLDEDGFLFVVDRKKDLILRGGFNVFPRDVEDALLEHPAVAAAGVVGRPDEAHGEEVVAFVSLREPLEADQLVDFGKARLGALKYPREVHVVPSLPLTPVGKVDRKALRAMLSETKEATWQPS